MAKAGRKEERSALRWLPWPQMGSSEHAVDWWPSEIRQAWARWRFHYLHGVLWPQLRAGGQYSMMWITQNSSCKALECTVLWQQDFLPNSILGSEHTPINTCKRVCWEIRGGLVLGTIHRPPTEWKVHTWIIESRLYWRQKSGFLYSGQGGGNPVSSCDSWLHFLGSGNGKSNPEKGWWQWQETGTKRQEGLL